MAYARTPDSGVCTKEDQSKCHPPYKVCDLDTGFCEHKNVFPIEWPEFIGALLMGVTIALCNAAGIGGGGIVVTIGITLFFFSPKESVAMSNVVIFFGCITRFIRRFHEKHPLKDATAIDYNIVTCQLPLVMLGTYGGVLVNEFLPETLVFITLFVTLVYLTYNSMVTAINTRRKENQEIAKKRHEALRLSINEESAPSRKKIEEFVPKAENKSKYTCHHILSINGIKTISKFT